jgi:2-hydroxychromene-2-carboxylate isomerase
MLFYFDFISPYAYLAWTQIHALAARHGQSVEPVPVLFAALLNAHGHKGPAEIPAKRAYLARDVCRKAHHLGLPPVVPPPSHPFNPLLALRAACYPLPADPRRRLIDTLYAATWAGGGGVETEDAVGAACARAGLDAAPILEFTRSDAAKAALRNYTEAALAAGLFGVPTVVVDGELFWGTDSLPTLEDHLAGARPLSPELVQRWQELKPSASRLR